MGALKFLIEGFKNLKTVGAIASTSKFVGRYMASLADVDKAKCVVEFGGGDGSITKQILQQIGPDTKLIVFEINEVFCKELQKKYGDDPRFTLVSDDAKKIGEYIQQAGFDCADAVVSAIPFSLIPEDDIIEAARDHLRPGGKYVQLQYSTVTKKRYEKIFGNVKVHFEMKNIPPAFIHVSEKRL